MDDSTENTKQNDASGKNITSNLTQEGYKTALYELWLLLKSIYAKHIKNHSTQIGNVRVPRLLLVILGIFALYLISPMSCIFNTAPQSNSVGVLTDNTYNDDGIKIDEMRKCDLAACGILEYTGKDDIEKLRIAVMFYNAGGEAVYEGLVEVLQLAPNSRIEFKIPSEEEFAYFKLLEVAVNPEGDYVSAFE